MTEQSATTDRWDALRRFTVAANGIHDAAERVRAVMAGAKNSEIEKLRALGWIVCPPGHIPMPRNRDEAAKMHLLAERYLRDNPEAVPHD